MSNQTISLSDELYDYLLDVSLREHPVLQRLRAETMTLEMSNMQIAPEQGQFMALLLKMINARRYLEVGTFTGYSALAAALAMPDDAEVHALDLSEEWTDIARQYWQEAGVADRVQLHLAPAADTLATMLIEAAGSFDAAFIDADKTGYQAYIDSIHPLLRTGGLLMIDNVLWDGAVIDATDDSEDTQAIRAVNRSLADDERWDLSMVPIGDGLTLALKR
ncbi:MAG: methyltransferase domain-containing protein [Gammaproteobacteria bacterium]|nr:methyltransferase domain-containing protein [Gammaproteobacteria bacterium]